MNSIESRFVIGRSNILFAVVSVYTFQPGHFTGWGSDGVNVKCVRFSINFECESCVHNHVLSTALVPYGRGLDVKRPCIYFSTLVN